MIHVTVGHSSKVHSADVEALASDGYAVTLYVTACGMSAITEHLGGWMKQVDQPVTCLRCLASATGTKGES